MTFEFSATFNAAARMNGGISELAFWGSELDPGAVKALYHSTAGRYYAKSGIISTPNRVKIRYEDDRQGSYPKQLRTTGHKENKGNSAIVFDDSSVQVFNPTDISRYPLNNSDINLKNLDLSLLIASPNQNSNIVTPSTASRPSVSEQGAYVFQDEDDFKPFDESRVFLEDKYARLNSLQIKQITERLLNEGQDTLIIGDDIDL